MTHLRKLLSSLLVSSVAASFFAASGCASIVGIHDLDDDAAAPDEDASTGPEAAPPKDAALDSTPDSAPDSAPDAAPAPCSAASCPAPGTCDNKGVCSYTCNGALACLFTIVCPAGIECSVDCTNGACSAGIDCSKASKCDLKCQMNSCDNGEIVCGGTGSTLMCDPNSCKNASETSGCMLTK